MHVRLTGAHNAESAETRLAGLVVDGRIALDAGSLTRSLSVEELRELRHVFVTHRHYDHIRDLPALAYATPQAGTLHIYGPQDTLDALADHLMNDVIYSAYHNRAGRDGAPRAALHALEPPRPVRIGEITVTPYDTPHTAPAVGYSVEGNGARIAYTGDTGAGFSERFPAPLPDVLISEVTYSNAGLDDAQRNGHLTPQLLRTEVENIVRGAGRPPRIVVVHRNPDHERKIRQEIAALRGETGWDIIPGEADMTLRV